MAVRADGRAPQAKAGATLSELDSRGLIPLVTGVRRGSRGAGPAVISKMSLSEGPDAWSRVLVSEGHGRPGEEREPRNEAHRHEANKLPPPLERARESSELLRGRQ